MWEGVVWWVDWGERTDDLRVVGEEEKRRKWRRGESDSFLWFEAMRGTVTAGLSPIANQSEGCG